MEVAKLGAWRFDVGTGSVALDERMREIWGTDAHTLRLDDVRARIHPDDVATVDARIAGALDPGGDGTYAVEFRVVWPDGSTRWVGSRGAASFVATDRGRTPMELVGTAQDITAEKRAEEQLRASAERATFRATLTETLRPLYDPAQIASAAARILGTHLRASRVFYCEVEPDERHFSVMESYVDGGRSGNATSPTPLCATTSATSPTPLCATTSATRTAPSRCAHTSPCC